MEICANSSFCPLTGVEWSYGPREKGTNMMNTATATNVIAKAEQYIARVPYCVNEYNKNGIVCLWDGSYNNCVEWVNATNNNNRRNVRIEATTMQDALAALGYGYEVAKGEFNAYLAK